MNKKITQKELLDYINMHPGIRGIDLVAHFSVTPMTINRHLTLLKNQNRITKKGKTPHVQRYVTIAKEEMVPFLDATLKRFLEKERYQISITGEEELGVQGFVTRAKKRNLELLPALNRRIRHHQYIDSITTPYGIRATHKLNDYPQHHLTDLWYGHIYALPEFGKTKWGTRIELAKTYPSEGIFMKIFQSISPILQRIVIDKKIDAICFIKPTAKRTLQIMDYANKILVPELPRLRIQKTPGFFPAQKTLKHRDDRIANAQTSFEILPGNQKRNHILIIDDAVGSGSTLAEMSNKIITQGYAKKTTGFSFIGTANGIFEEIKHFEVLSAI